MMNNLTDTINKVIPVMAQGSILIGVLVCLLSLTIGFYYFLKKQFTEKVKTYIGWSLASGTIMIITGLITAFIMNFDINASSYKQNVPCGYCIGLIVFSLCLWRNSGERK